MEAVNIRIGPLEFDHADCAPTATSYTCTSAARNPAKAKKRPKDTL